jgi:hypothetical protein
MSEGIYDAICKQWVYEVNMLEIYKEYLISKNFKKSSELNQKVGMERLNELCKNLTNWINEDEDWSESQFDEILTAKRRLLLALIYFNFLEGSTRYSNLQFLNYKKANIHKILRIADASAKTFKDTKLIKLCLRAKLIALSISWEQIGKTMPKQADLAENSRKQLELDRMRLK